MSKMQVEDPPYLSVGTAVSAKYKGAFCEAKVHKLVRCVKCKVTYKTGLGTATVTDSEIKGTLRIGQLVQVKHPTNAKEYVEATITKMKDCSQYTVVFDDGDITTLRRTSLCLKSGRHFNESETLDQLPLTNPEHFGNPVVGGRRGRRNRQIKEDSSDCEPEEENEPDLEGYSVDIGRVRMYEITDKKRNKDSWFPGLVVIPSSASTTDKINIKEEYLIRSFKDGRYYTVPKKETRDFNREGEIKTDSSAVLVEAVQKALRYLDHNELPVHWERSSLFNTQQQMDSDSENFTDSSDDEPPQEEKDRFVAQLYKFLDEAGTPLNKTPSINGRDVDLHRLFRLVHKMGGYNRVTNQSKWKTVTVGLKLPLNQNVFNQVKSMYKKCLLSYENFNRTLGVTMLNHTRSTKKNSGRSLIRDRDRATPVNSPRPEKDEEIEKKEEPPKLAPDIKAKKKIELKKEDDKKKKDISEVSDTNSSGDATDQSESVRISKESRRPKRTEAKTVVVTKDKKAARVVTGEKVKALVEKFEEQTKKETDDKVANIQQTRSKTSTKIKESVTPEKKPETKTIPKESIVVKTPSTSKPLKKPTDDDKKKGKKKLGDEKASTSDSSASEPVATTRNVNIFDKLKVYYGPTHESKVTYEAKVIQVGKDQSGIIYLVHYTGWNNRYDEWITPGRIAENLSASSKAKRLKQSQSASKNSMAASGSQVGIPGTPSTSAKVAAKRGRGQSITGKSSGPSEPPPRSTTPSSITSNSSRTKSPATPATRSASRLQIKQDYSRKSRRTSSQTDISNHSDSESDGSDSESEELTRTRSGKSNEEVPEIKTYKKKLPAKPTLANVKPEKRKDDDDTEKEDEQPEKEKNLKRPKKFKKTSDKSADESDDEDGGNPPKGRDFDLNQIRSELKGFSKAVASSEVMEKESVSSSDDSTMPPPDKIIPEEIEEKVVVVVEKAIVSESSEDIYEFKEPEPFEFESRSKLTDDKNSKKRLVPRLFDDLDKSPKKKSPIKVEVKESSPEVEKKRFQRTPIKEEDLMKKEDPFDSLVQSPSFNYVKTSDKTPETKSSAVRNILNSQLFNDLNDQIDDYSTGDMDLSDSESQTPNIFSRAPNIFPESSPDHNTLDLEFSNGVKTDECKLKDSDDDDHIRAQVQLLIAQSSSTDDDSNEPLLITPSTSSYQAKKRDVETKPLTILGITPTAVTEKEEACEPPMREPSPMELEPAPLEEKPIMEKSVFVPIKPQRPIQISPALQETDSSLLESIVGSPALVTVTLEDTKEFNVKKPSSSKIADSILQKFNSIKKMESKSPKHEVEEPPVKKEPVEDVKPKVEVELKQKPTIDLVGAVVFTPKIIECKPSRQFVESKPKPIEIKTVPLEVKKPLSPVSPRFDSISDLKKRKKIISKPFIEDSDSDSSDSEQLVIARSDEEDSQSNSIDIHKPDAKESDSNISQIATTDDSQSQEDERNFKFDHIKEDTIEVSQEEVKEETKEEEQDTNFHSLLLCEETIPRSPAPPPDPPAMEDLKPVKSVLEMPFASAPGTSNVKNIIIEQKISPKPVPMPVVIPMVDREREREVSRPDASAVLDNTPPNTPESTISNLSPRGENGGLSPNAADNESGKSNDVETDYPSLHHRTAAQKVSPYSEEDTQMTDATVKKRDDGSGTAGGSKKRRRSCRADDQPAKRGRKPLNRLRHNSDSDDTSEHSTTGSTNVGTYDISERAPRPTKYNFILDLDPSLDSAQRIALLQQQMSELKKTYVDVKAELALVERRRKKIRRREREALKASKQEALAT